MKGAASMPKMRPAPASYSSLAICVETRARSEGIYMDGGTKGVTCLFAETRARSESDIYC